ncbi:MAG: hypothetical protein K2K53_07690, partial [Oscillospiraceae bacterium]|nr:hypothetical protein [Oscillospiraceae bacterium]
MNYEFLKRLYYSAAAPGTPCKGRRLQEMYEQTPELAQAWREINASLGAIESDSVSAALNQLWEASELQGFINGFRLCAQLGRELGTTEGDPTSPDKYMTPMQGLEGLASPRQIRFLEARGFQHVETWSFWDAKSMI